MLSVPAKKANHSSLFNVQPGQPGKGCDWLLANEVGADKGFGKDENEINFLRRDNPAIVHWPQQSKQQVAQQLTQEIIEFFKVA